jgi:hypothetical protein
MVLIASLRRLAVAAAIAAVSVCGSDAQSPAASRATFAGVITALSEPNGYFDTDNLISNEQSYLTVLSDIDRAGLRGGAYIGVGPDQNFSYIAASRPAVAFIVDVRRDNLLLHLLFKALFSLARTRVEYLSLLCGRPVPPALESWRNRNIEAIAAYVDQAAVPDAAAVNALRARVTSTIASFGLALGDADRETIDRFHRRFIEAGLGLRFQSYGRGPQSYYPTLRDLLLAGDSGQRQQNYLASEEGFQFLKDLQAHDRVIPVVGNLTGPTALVGIGRWLREHDETLSLFYASNVEFYLFREGTFDRFMANLSHIPHSDRALIIRSVFGYGGGSVSQTQAVPDLLDGVAHGRYRDYWQLVR